MSTARRIRIGILLLILGLVAFDTWITRLRTTDWDYPLRVSVYPIAADGRQATRDYVQDLKHDDFVDVETFLQQEARRYGVTVTPPLRMMLRPVLSEPPPLPPADRGLFPVAWWSLKLRWWARGVENAQARPRHPIRLFVLYYDPQTQSRVAHSLGLQKGLIGIVHAFASRPMAPTNNVVIAHELLHTLGATDKYDPATGLPRHPEGYAEPEQRPLHPQTAAELMGGRIPVSPMRADIPENLREAIVGPHSAREIGWSSR
jgi:hypothetical protein